MLKFLIVTILLTGLGFAAPSTISGPLYLADGTTLANGTVTINWPNFSASDGHYVPAGGKIITVTSGTFSQALEPSTNSSPAFSYRITYKFGSQSPAQCSWVVSTSSAGIASVETCPTAASSIPATGISLSQISSGGGANGQCMILSAGVWSAQACTQNWTVNVNDIYSSNTGNVGIGGTPGAYKLDVTTGNFHVAGYGIFDAGPFTIGLNPYGTGETTINSVPQSNKLDVVLVGGSAQSTLDLFDVAPYGHAAPLDGHYFAIDYQGFANGARFVDTLNTTPTGFCFALGHQDAGLALGSNCGVHWSSTVNSYGTPDTGISRNSVGTMEVNNGTIGTFRDIIVRSPIWSATSPATLSNSQCTLTLTNNTTVTMTCKGSDGTTRTTTFTIS